MGTVCSAAAGSDVLTTFGSLAAFMTYFGGGHTYGRPPSEQRFLGVWGHRNASRFRRLLRERLGELEVVHGMPPEPISLGSTVAQRPTPTDRQLLEAKIRRSWSKGDS